MVRNFLASVSAHRPLCRFIVVWAILTVAIGPHLTRLLHASIFGDDVLRIWLIQQSTTLVAIFSPFNEHVAPFFDSVSWLTWHAAGGRLVALPKAYTLASFVPFLLALAALSRFASRELGSKAASCVVLAVFAVSPLHVVETVWWYSGSSCMWALFWTLLALLGASRGDFWGVLLAGLCIAIAPASSAMGVMAAPAVFLYGWLRLGKQGWKTAAASIAGTAIYTLVAVSCGLIGAVATGARLHANPEIGLLGAGRAPSTVLIPALFGLNDIDLALPTNWGIALTGAFTLVVICWTLRSRQKGVIFLGLLLILGGYVMIYPFRTWAGHESMFRIARYHMFPQLGLALLVGAAARSWVAERWWLAAAAVGLLVVIHDRKMKSEAALYDFPNQHQTLAALEHVGDIALAQGITRAQAIAAIEPIRPHWMPLDQETAQVANVARLLRVGAESSRVPDAEVRGRLLAALGPEDREGLFGEMDVGPYLVSPAGPLQSAEVLAEAVPSGVMGVRATGSDGVYETRGWPSYLEYTFNGPADLIASARLLSVPAMDEDDAIEVWWAADGEKWSEGRSVRWRFGNSDPGHEWAVPLERLPHWHGRHSQKLRLMFKYPGMVAAGPPKLLK